MLGRSLLLASLAAGGIVIAGCSSSDGSSDPSAVDGDAGAPPSPTSTSPTGAPTDGGAGLPPLGPPQTGGVMLDAHGGIHPFGGAKVDTTNAPTWTTDTARALVVLADGSGGWMLEGSGAIHSFGKAPAITSPKVVVAKDWARAIVVLSDRQSGYLLDAQGAVLPFGHAPVLTGAPTFMGDEARGLDVHLDTRGVPDGAWVLDGFGGVHELGAAPDVGAVPSWAGYDVWTKLHVVKGGAWAIGRWGIVQPVGMPAGVSLMDLVDYKEMDIVRDIVPMNPSGAWDMARTLDCPTAGTYCGFDGIRGGTNVLYECSKTGGAPAKATVCGKGCAVMPAGTPDYCKGEVACSMVQWWNSALTYGPYMSNGWWDTDLAVSSSSNVQLRHDARLDKTGVYAWGYMPEFTDMVTGKRFRFLHLRPQHQYVTNVGEIYPAGTLVGLSGGDTADTGLGQYSTGAHLCVQTLDTYRNTFPAGTDPCN
jgi:hypothetical protein